LGPISSGFNRPFMDSRPGLSSPGSSQPLMVPRFGMFMGGF
jgi:hypothetical protein